MRETVGHVHVGDSCCLYFLIILLSVSDRSESFNVVHISGKSKVSSLISSTVDVFWCPDGCTCSTSEKIIDCSSLGLIEVPECPPSTTRL